MKTVVVLEDDVDSQDVYKMLLEEEGYRCEAFTNSSEVMDYMKNNPNPCVFVMDLTFPGPSAEEMLKSFGEKKFPIIVVSGKSNIKEEVKRLGLRFYLPKPFDLEDFMIMIKKF